jgi:hypothetical protein
MRRKSKFLQPETSLSDIVKNPSILGP